MYNIKFIKPLFDPIYFKHVFDTQINHELHKVFSSVIHDFIMITIYSDENQNIKEKNTTAEYIWTPSYKFLGKTAYTTTLHTGADGTVLAENGYKTVPLHSVSHESIADKKKYYSTCKTRNFMYLWYSIHKGPHETPMHVDKNSPLRYVQCISKNHKHSEFTYDNNKLIINEGDAFIFDPKYTHSVITGEGCDTIFLIGNCIENTIDEFNV